MGHKISRRVPQVAHPQVDHITSCFLTSTNEKAFDERGLAYTVCWSYLQKKVCGTYNHRLAIVSRLHEYNPNTTILFICQSCNITCIIERIFQMIKLIILKS